MIPTAETRRLAAAAAGAYMANCSGGADVCGAQAPPLTVDVASWAPPARTLHPVPLASRVCGRAVAARGADAWPPSQPPSSPLPLPGVSSQTAVQSPIPGLGECGWPKFVRCAGDAGAPAAALPQRPATCASVGARVSPCTNARGDASAGDSAGNPAVNDVGRREGGCADRCGRGCCGGGLGGPANLEPCSAATEGDGPGRGCGGADTGVGAGSGFARAAAAGCARPANDRVSPLHPASTSGGGTRSAGCNEDAGGGGEDDAGGGSSSGISSGLHCGDAQGADDDTNSCCDSSPYPLVPAAPLAPPWWWGGACDGVQRRRPVGSACGLLPGMSLKRPSAAGGMLLQPDFVAAAATAPRPTRLWRQHSAPCSIGFGGGSLVPTSPQPSGREWSSGGSGAVAAAATPRGPRHGECPCMHCAAQRRSAETVLALSAPPAAVTRLHDPWRRGHPYAYIHPRPPYHHAPYASRPPPAVLGAGFVGAAPPLPIAYSAHAPLSPAAQAAYAMQAAGACPAAAPVREAYGPVRPWRRVCTPVPCYPYFPRAFSASAPLYAYDTQLPAHLELTPAPHFM